MSDSKNISADVKVRRKAVFMHEIRRICSYLNVPFQNAKKIYSPEHGFQSGTMFPELNKPFMCGAKERGEQND